MKNTVITAIENAEHSVVAEVHTLLVKLGVIKETPIPLESSQENQGEPSVSGASSTPAAAPTVAPVESTPTNS